jgi:hypothetical protein
MLRQRGRRARAGGGAARRGRRRPRPGPEIAQIDSTIASAVRNDLGQWQVRLQEGGTWIQTDFNPIAVAPRPGQPVVVHRGALGSYMMRVNRQPGVRVRRVL